MEKIELLEDRVTSLFEHVYGAHHPSDTNLILQLKQLQSQYTELVDQLGTWSEFQTLYQENERLLSQVTFSNIEMTVIENQHALETFLQSYQQCQQIEAEITNWKTVATMETQLQQLEYDQQEVVAKAMGLHQQIHLLLAQYTSLMQTLSQKLLGYQQQL